MININDIIFKIKSKKKLGDVKFINKKSKFTNLFCFNLKKIQK